METIDEEKDDSMRQETSQDFEASQEKKTKSRAWPLSIFGRLKPKKDKKNKILPQEQLQ